MSEIKIKSLLVNNATLPEGYVPNTLKYKLGVGETNVRASVSGNTTTTVHSQNAETKISEFMVDVYPFDSGNPDDMRKFIEVLASNTGNNTVVVSASGGSTVSFSNVSLTNDPEVNDSFDGVISLEFKGNPAVVS